MRKTKKVKRRNQDADETSPSEEEDDEEDKDRKAFERYFAPYETSSDETDNESN
jgi:hypothetical protein